MLKDACVYFNDSISQREDGKWMVSETYYTQERVAKLKYTNTVLKDMVLDDADLQEYPGYGTFWTQDGAAKYHNEILKSFLQYYAK